MRTALTTLNHIFPRWKLGDEQFTNLVEAYGSALKDFDAETVEGAVGLAMKTEQRWPPAATLRDWRASGCGAIGPNSPKPCAAVTHRTAALPAARSLAGPYWTA